MTIIDGSLSAYAGVSNNYQDLYPAAQAAASSGVEQEFLEIFYKQLLKQAFQAPNFAPFAEEDGNSNSFFTAFKNDIIVDQLAQELVRGTDLRNQIMAGQINENKNQ
jgi:hypothetical protein